MKIMSSKIKFIVWLSLFFLSLCACKMAKAQKKYPDLSRIFSYHQEQLYGFVGSNYQRLILHYDTIYMDATQNKYYAKGAIICQDKKYVWEGIIQPVNVKNRGISCVLTSRFTLLLSDLSRIEGNFITLYRQEKNSYVYDDSDYVSDSYMNNYFIGIWMDKNKTQKCCWGEFRIPESGDLDIGVGEFSPNEKYYPYGWSDFE